MTTKDTELLISHWGADPRPPILRDPWERRSSSSEPERATRTALRNRPDFGWALAERLAVSRRTCPILKRREFRWIRAARNLHTGGVTAAKHLRDLEIVKQARFLHKSPEIRPILNALLMTRDATAQTVAEALNIKPVEVVEAYGDLFFSVLGRKEDLAYILNLLGHGKPASLFICDSSLRRHIDAFSVPTPRGASNTLLQDLADDPVPKRMEATLHPQFLVKGSDALSLKTLVENCHLRTALVVQPKLELAKKGSHPSKDLKILINVLDGMTVMKRPDSIERGRDASLLAKAHALLALTKPEIQAMHAMDPEHLNRFLWLKTGESKNHGPSDANACETLLNAYQRTLEEILDLRREGRALMVEFSSPRMAAGFESERHAYEDEILRTAAGAGPWARGLPQIFFWALGFLRRSLPADRRPDDAGLMASSFAAARRLVENHRDQVLVITNAGLLAERRKLARRIVKILGDALSPQPFREINRSFHRKKKEILAPVVEALIEVGVLVRDDDRNLTLGPVELADVEEILNQKFAQSQ